MRAFIPEKGLELGNDINLATSILARMKGLLGKESLKNGQGLLIRPCNSIHTFFMKFPIDAVFLDKDNRVVVIFRNLPTYRLTSIYRKSVAVLELPAGTVTDSISIGDRLEIF